MRMRKVYLGMQAAVGAMLALGVGMIPRHQALRPEEVHYVMPSRFRKKKRGPMPSFGRSQQSLLPSDLIADRSSSFKKMRRAVNAGRKPMQPDATALMRHSWYRRQMLREASAL